MTEESHIHKAIDKAESSARKFSISIDRLKWVIFSDHHRGRRDGADDFMPCELTYIQALQFYFDNNYTLVLLGDVEEFWENPFLMVMKRYREVLDLEKKFYDDNRLIRVWGNHDDAWRFKDTIKKYLKPFVDIEVSEAISLDITMDGNLLVNMLLLHGHQGNLESDRYAWISKFFVRYVWRNFQRVFKVPLSTPANNVKMRSQHDIEMYNWAASRNQQVIVCGHTHQPVFMSMTHSDKLKLEIHDLEKSLEKNNGNSENIILEIAKRKDRLEMLAKQSSSIIREIDNYVPCYFNSGCCSFGDGDITGLEMSDGRIKLVKWRSKDIDDPMLLGDASLKNISNIMKSKSTL